MHFIQIRPDNQRKVGPLTGSWVAIAVGLIYIGPTSAAPGDTTLVVPSPSSSTAIGGSIDPVMSGDGRYVVFRSTAPNLVAADENFFDDVFVFDRTTNANIRIENPEACLNPIFDSFWISDASISSDGRYVLWSVVDYCLYDDSSTASMVLLDRQTNTRQVLGSTIDSEFLSAQFSADSRFIVFELSDYSSSEIWLYELSTSQTVLVSRGANENGTASSFSPSISSDGSLIVFASDANDLVGNDTNGVTDIFLYRRSMGEIELVSKSNSGAQGNGPSGEPTINAAGTHIAYSSDASNLVAEDTNNAADVFTYAIATGKTARISKQGIETQLNGPSFHPSISSDARYVVFSSLATNAVAGDTNNVEDVFLRDRRESLTTRLSVPADGGQGNGSSRRPTISSNSRYVTFASKASNFAADDLNRADDIFVLDRQMLSLSLVTRSVAPVAGLNAFSARISADGTQVVFESDASNLVPSDTNETTDIYVRDYTKGQYFKISKSSDGRQPNGFSTNPCISSDGRFVGYTSYASNLVPDDTNYEPDVFVRDRQGLTTVRVNVSTNGDQADYGGITDCQISANGQFVLFSSDASTLVPGDEGFSSDLFIRDLVEGTTEFAVVNSSGERLSSAGVMNSDGRYIAFVTRENIAPGDTEFDDDVYLRDRQTGALERISVPTVALAEPFCCGRAGVGAISANGRYVAFFSDAPDLVAGDNGNFYDTDVFIRDRQLGTTAKASILPASLRSTRRFMSGLSISDNGRFITFTAQFNGIGPFVGPYVREVFFRDMQRGVAARASRNAAGEAANSDAYDSSMSADGRLVVFTSGATNLAPEPIQAETAFMHERPASIAVAPASLGFGSVQVGTLSAIKVVTISNTGPVQVGLKSIIIGGTNPGQFKKANNCPAQLAVGAQCTVSVTFKPSSTGAKSALLTVTPAVGRSKVVALAGTGS